MTFEELLMVIDPNADGGEILELEFRGNEEYNRVRSDCVEILEPLFEYQVNSIGVNDNCEQRIWLDPPKADRKTEPTTEDWQDWKDRMWAEAIVTEPTTEDCSTVPTSSKMEQVDEPQTCSVNGRPYDCGNCEYHKCTADELQTDYTPDCPFCVRYGTDECLKDKCRHYQTYKDEPQTDCETCRYAGECDWEPWQECPYAPKTEPQTERSE